MYCKLYKNSTHVQNTVTYLKNGKNVLISSKDYKINISAHGLAPSQAFFQVTF